METQSENAAPEVQTQRKLPGRPFQRGNPGGPGRPPRTEVERAAAVAEKARREVFRIAKDELAGDLTQLLKGGIPSAINALASIVEDEKADPAVRVSAARELLDRSLGKPLQSSQVAVADVTPRLDRAEAQKRIDAILAGKVIEHEPSIFD